MSSKRPESQPATENSGATQEFREVNARIGELLISGIASDDPRFAELNRRLDEAAVQLHQERTAAQAVPHPRLGALARVGLYFGFAYADPSSAQLANQAVEKIRRGE